MVARADPPTVVLPVLSLDRVAFRLLLSRWARHQWIVHGVFQRALNLGGIQTFPTWTGREIRVGPPDILSIVSEAAPNAAATVRVALPAGLPPLNAFLPAHQPCRVDRAQRQLSIGSGLTLDFRGARLWRPDPIRRTASNHALRLRLWRAARIGAERAPTGGLATLLPEVLDLAVGREGRSSDALEGDISVTLVSTARQPLLDLAAAVRSGNSLLVGRAARKLSGLGEGLTPSGDDVIYGVVAALTSCRAFSSALKTAVKLGTARRTTDLASARMRYALDGHFDAWTLDVLRALLDGPPGQVPAAVERLLALGHSSGADTLLGVLLGARLAPATT